MINLTKFSNKNLFFVGIGGISMSAICCFCTQFGAKVSGSDVCKNEEVDKLKRLGINISIGHKKENISKDIDLVVYSEAILEDNPEREMAGLLNIPQVARSEFLGFLSGQYLNSIVVAGTHGKTTTTALLGEILINEKLHPTIHLGGESLRFGNSLVGNRDIFLTEGCEYKNSIKHLNPNTTLITAIELDHTDFYKDLSEIEDAFLELSNKTKQNVVVFENKEFSRRITEKVSVIDVGFGDGYDICGKNLVKLKNGCWQFDVYYGGYVGRFKTNIVGEHNAKNCLCAVAVALVLNIDLSTIYNSLRGFQGVKRRFEKVGEIDNVPVICDYAHHPTEIKSSIKTAKEIFNNITVIFQPHTYSRTLGLMEEFKTSFVDAKNLAIFKTYPAREKYISGGGAKDLLKKIKHKNKCYLENKKQLKEYLHNREKTNCILVLGAGDIYDMTKRILKQRM